MWAFPMPTCIAECSCLPAGAWAKGGGDKYTPYPKGTAKAQLFQETGNLCLLTKLYFGGQTEWQGVYTAVEVQVDNQKRPSVLEEENQEQSNSSLRQTLQACVASYRFLRTVFASSTPLPLLAVFLLLPFSLSFLAVLCDTTALALIGPLLERVIEESASYSSEQRSEGLTKSLLGYLGLDAQTSMLTLVFAVLTFSIIAVPLRKSGEFIISLNTTKLGARLHARLMEQVLGFGKLYFQTTDLSHMQELRSLAESFTTGGIRLVHKLFESSAYLLFYLAIMCSISLPLTLFFIIAGSLMTISTSYFRTRISKLVHQKVEYSKRLRNVDRSCFQSIDIVKGYGIESKMAERIRQRAGEKLHHEQKLIKLSTTVSIAQDIAGLCIVFMAVAGYLYFDAALEVRTAANAAVFLLVARRLFEPIAQIHRICLQAANITPGIKALQSIFSDSGKYIPSSGSIALPPGPLALRVENLSFSYPGDFSALRSVNFRIPAGTTTAVVGRSGAGKSTLIKLLLKSFVAPDGAIEVEGCGDINTIDRNQWCKRIGYIPQATSLFSGTLRDNLCIALEESPSDEELHTVLKRVDLPNLVDRLANGLDSLIGDGGNSLSRGEKQRVSVARMILQDPDLVLIDEATSSLDPYTERLLTEVLRDFCRNRTTVVVAHRLQTIQTADQVLVLDEGNLLEQGSVEDLLAKRGLFYRLWQINTNGALLHTGQDAGDQA